MNEILTANQTFNALTLLKDSFSFLSTMGFKICMYKTGFLPLVDVATDIIGSPQSFPHGTIGDKITPVEAIYSEDIYGFYIPQGDQLTITATTLEYNQDGVTKPSESVYVSLELLDAEGEVVVPQTQPYMHAYLGYLNEGGGNFFVLHLRFFSDEAGTVPYSGALWFLSY
jgi:hypothetical protein